MPALGERFRAARESRGLSLSDVSEQIRIRSIYLAAIEEENWTVIGAPVYIRGFLRTYARFLGLDPEEVVATFNGAPPSAAAAPARGTAAELPPFARVASAAQPEAGPASRRGSWLVWAAALVAVLLVAFVVYNELTMHRESASTTNTGSIAVAPSPAPSQAESSSPFPAGASPLPSAASPAVSPSPGVDGPNSIALVLSQPSWLRVTVDGNVSMEGTFPAGTSKSFHGKTALVRIGNAGGVEIYVNGKDVGKLGKPGDVAEHSFTL